ncbi:DUF998 domain-containing protein [Nakamurella endophytica]|uniref:DUF998 domain-containing protein n=1 Tax=Nakamurella endophytica TaxID=1748367 RepID=A0A917SPP0_9ACTN|nr:DUF998 domain-containing protein [Nakamurella endophytica]GGL92756.1 hypothetical protein GCM10011594_10710 [Nakamurella endophytica]
MTLQLPADRLEPERRRPAGQAAAADPTGSDRDVPAHPTVPASAVTAPAPDPSAGDAVAARTGEPGGLDRGSALGAVADPVAVQRDAPAAHRLALVGLAAVAVSTVAIGLLHVLPAGRALDPLSRTISEYALTPIGWLFNGGVLVLSAGSAAVLAAVVASGLARWRTVGAAMLATWCVGLVGLTVFHKQALGVETAVGSRVHWTWTLIAFFSLPLGALLTCRTAARAGERWPRWAVRLSWVAAGWFGVLAVQTVLSATTRVPAWRLVGFVERALSLTEMAAVAVLALWVLQRPALAGPDGARLGPSPAVATRR